MIYSSLLVVAATLSGFATAQGNFTTCCNVNPSTVDAPTRASWCRAQMNTCPLLCPNGNTQVNTCDNNALTFECQCGGGSPTPNITDYAQTLDSLECDEWRAQCTAAHPNDLAGQTFCQSFVCGSKNATAAFVSSEGGASSSASAAASSATRSAASAASSAAASATAKAAASAIKIGKEYGTVAMGAGMLALFGFAL